MKRTVSVAPMMDCTDRHDRFFLRLISKNVMLYSEMVATKSAIHGDRKKILSFSPEEKPLALQVGGSDKKELSEVAKIAEDMGYDEININLGCPSKKVQKNMFGACLMKEPDLVSECINEMVNSCKIPVTAKTRIGFDDTEDFDYLNKFILKMNDAGCKTFILHARKAILKGLTPKQNLNIPKLNYDMVYKIKKANPNLEIIINGGISKIEEIGNRLANNPYKNSPFEPPYGTFNVGTIEGGAARNATAGWCNFDWEFRPMPGEDNVPIISEIEKYAKEVILPSMKSINNSANIEIITEVSVPSFDDRLSEKAANFVSEVTGKNSRGVVSFGTDAGYFSDGGYSTVVCGPGTISRAHAPDEYITVDEMNQGMKFMKDIATKLAG